MIPHNFVPNNDLGYQQKLSHILAGMVIIHLFVCNYHQVMRGDFSTADVDLQVPTMTRKAIAVALAPDMRTLQHEALRELNTGAMSAAVLLSYFDLVYLESSFSLV